MLVGVCWTMIDNVAWCWMVSDSDKISMQNITSASCHHTSLSLNPGLFPSSIKGLAYTTISLVSADRSGMAPVSAL